MFLRHNVLGFSWALFTFILSALPGSQFQDHAYPYADKIVHIILYSVLFLLLTVGFIKQRKFSWLRNQTKIKVFVGAVCYGLLIELLQGFVFKQRSIELADMLANAAGAGMGWLLFLLVYGKQSYA